MQLIRQPALRTAAFLVGGLLITAWTTFPALAASGVNPEAPGAPVRLLLITLDTLRADHLGVYGYDRPTSPNLDAFAQMATVFRDATCSMPTTQPSHLSIFTGLTPAQHGVTENGMIPPRDFVSLFELLKPRGVRSAAVVSGQFLKQQYLAGLGIDEVFFGDGGTPDVNQVPGDTVTSRALSWLADHGAAPFALWVHYFDTHEPYNPSPRFAERFAVGYDGPLGDNLSTPWLVSLNQGDNAARLSERDRQHVVDLYDAEIAYVDAELERLFSFLKKRDLYQDTLIVVIGDHGQAHGEANFWGHGELLLEPVVRIPLLVKLPRQRHAFTVSSPVESLDLLPTLAAFFGLETPPNRRGRSLLTTLQSGAPPAPAPPRIIERRTYAAPERLGLALHAGAWKLTFYRESDGDRYHLGRDSGTGGLDGEDFYTPDGDEMLLLREVAANRPPVGEQPAFSAETLEQLRALGYVR